MPEKSTNNLYIIGENVQDPFIDLLSKNTDVMISKKKQTDFLTKKKWFLTIQMLFYVVFSQWEKHFFPSLLLPTRQ